MSADEALQIFNGMVLGAPAVLFALLTLPLLFGWRWSERALNRSISTLIIIGLAGALGILVVMVATGQTVCRIDLGDWIVLPKTPANPTPFHFHWKVVYDRLSVPWILLTFLLAGTVGVFGSRYLHRETGYWRFFTAYAAFTWGLVIAFLAGTIEMLFIGWELVGLSSTLLIAYFHERPGPVRNGLRVWWMYRLADAAFLLAAITLHHLVGAGDFERMAGQGSWPVGVAQFSHLAALLVGALLLIAAAGKSALIPFSGWLPRAMEGPTPSSAIFYGALSVHLGAYLLLRLSPLLDCSLALAWLVAGWGGATALYAAVVGRVQIDVKAALSFAALTQVGLIVTEIGLASVFFHAEFTTVGICFRYFALIHMLGHACLRTLQFLRAPSLLRDYHSWENSSGRRVISDSNQQSGLWANRWYRFGIERGFLDSAIDSWVISPLQHWLLRFDAWERRWTAWIAGSPREGTGSVPLQEWRERSNELSSGTEKEQVER